MLCLPKMREGSCLHELRGFKCLMCLCPQEQWGQCCHEVLQPVVVQSSGGVWRLGTRCLGESQSHVQGLDVLARSLTGNEVPRLLNPRICMG